MQGFIAYSRPRGIYGRFILTVSLSFFPGERARIEVKRMIDQKANTYSCSSCGHWGTITVMTPVFGNIGPTEHQKKGTMEFYRYDNVEPGDFMELTLIDPELLFYQFSHVNITQNGLSIYNQMRQSRKNAALPYPSQFFYNINLIDWDQHCQTRKKEEYTTTVEEELIQHVMNAEPITIKQLQLGSPKQPASLQMPFVEGTLMYLEDKSNG